MTSVEFARVICIVVIITLAMFAGGYLLGSIAFSIFKKKFIRLLKAISIRIENKPFDYEKEVRDGEESIRPEDEDDKRPR